MYNYSAFNRTTKEQREAIKRKYAYMCLSCRKFEPQVTLEVDHIKPLLKGGASTDDNLQPLCRQCNQAKYTRETNFIEKYLEEN